jgi:WD40 repeat protein
VDPTHNPPRNCLVRFASDGKTFDKVIEDLDRLGRAALSPDGKLLAASIELGPERKDLFAPTQIEIWDVETGQRRPRLGGHWNTIDEIAFSDDGKKLATVAHFADVIKIWSLKEAVP